MSSDSVLWFESMGVSFYLHVQHTDREAPLCAWHGAGSSGWRHTAHAALSYMGTVVILSCGAEHSAFWPGSMVSHCTHTWVACVKIHKNIVLGESWDIWEAANQCMKQTVGGVLLRVHPSDGLHRMGKYIFNSICKKRIFSALRKNVFFSICWKFCH